LERRYVVELNDRESFWPQLHAAAAAQGVLDRERVVWLSDVPIRRTVPRRRLKSARMGEREVATSARRETASPRIVRKSMPFACGPRRTAG